MESGVLRTRARRAGKRRLAVISAALQSWPFALGRAGFSHHEGAVYRSTDLPRPRDAYHIQEEVVKFKKRRIIRGGF